MLDPLFPDNTVWHSQGLTPKPFLFKGVGSSAATDSEKSKNSLLKPSSSFKKQFICMDDCLHFRSIEHLVVVTLYKRLTISSFKFTEIIVFALLLGIAGNLLTGGKI